ncbi:hypothetical protein FKM82_007767 [Ascaphus truei]
MCWSPPRSSFRPSRRSCCTDWGRSFLLKTSTVQQRQGKIAALKE